MTGPRRASVRQEEWLSDRFMLQVRVTGGCGFIGSNFVRYLLETDPEVSVVNYDCLTYAGNPASLADIAGNSRYRFAAGDITDRQVVRSVLGKGIRGVI